MTSTLEVRGRYVDVFSRVIEEGFNSGNLSNLDTLFHPEFIEHQRGFPTPDLDGLKAGIASLRRAIPDLHLEVVESIAEGDKVCFLLAGTGTHQGQLGPVPATGTPLSVSVIDICRFEDDLIIEHWGIPDQAGIMEQIGLPQPPRWLMRLLIARRSKRRVAPWRKGIVDLRRTR